MTIILSFVFFSSLFLPLFYQPLSLGLLIMILSFFLSLSLGLCGHSFLGFILFLVFVGGLLVMFGYVVVIIPNMHFTASLFFFFFFFIFLVYWSSFSSSFFSLPFLVFSFSNFFVFIGLVLVLLFCLVVVVKVCYFHSGSLRPFYSL